MVTVAAAYLAGQESGDRDLFWELLPEQRYDLGHEPSEHTIGQLSESWAQLVAMAGDPDRAVGYGFVWLADVLRALGQQSLG